MEFLKIDELLKFLETACDHYEHTAPTVHQYLNDLYIRINEVEPVDLQEIIFVQRLKVGNIWTNPNQAANDVYHHMPRMGLSVEGHLGF